MMRARPAQQRCLAALLPSFLPAFLPSFLPAFLPNPHCRLLLNLVSVSGHAAWRRSPLPLLLPAQRLRHEDAVQVSGGGARAEPNAEAQQEVSMQRQAVFSSPPRRYDAALGMFKDVPFEFEPARVR
eukprot:756692-Hanusia_phi.AAC.2